MTLLNEYRRSALVVIVVSAVTTPTLSAAIGGAVGQRCRRARATKCPRGFKDISILCCVRVVVKRNVASPLRNFHLRFLALIGLERTNPKDALQIMGFKRLVKLDGEGLWQDGLVEFLCRGDEFELVGMIGVTLECPRNRENARVQRLGFVGPGHGCAANIDETFVVVEAEMTMEELNAQEIVDIVFDEDLGEDGIHDLGRTTLFAFGVSIVERGECVEC